MKKQITILVILLLYSLPLRSLDLNIDILSKDYQPIPVLFYEFYTDDRSKELNNEIIEIIMSDLTSSGAFELSTSLGVNVLSDNNGFYQYYITGEVKYSEDLKKHTVRVSILDFNKKSVKSFGYILDRKPKVNDLAKLSHDISNEVYESILQIDGYFDSSLLFTDDNKLFISDYDGKNKELLLEAQGTILSPSFSNNGNYVIYIDFIKGSSILYVYDLYFDKSIRIGRFDGISLSPVFSSDDKKIMFSLARGGSTNIYEIEIASGAVKRLTKGYSINITGNYSHDNKYISFSSDRVGSSQLYVLDKQHNTTKRLSRGSGVYHDPIFSPESNLLTFVKIEGTRFKIGLMNLLGDETIISSNSLVRNPYWLPGGRHIIYEYVYKKEKNKEQIAFYIMDILSGEKLSINPIKSSRYPSMSRGVLPMKKINAKYFF